MRRIPLGYYVGAAVVAIVALVAGPFLWSVVQPQRECGASVAGADVGGPFTLVSETGETVTESDVITGPTLVYFGYTFCPDVCPFDAVRNADAVDLLAERGLDVGSVFVSVDPARDTPEVMADYTAYMHPEMVGLTGSPEQVAEAARAYRVFYRAAGEGEDYLVDHTTFTYLMGPDGIIDFFRRDASAEEIAERTACHLGA